MCRISAHCVVLKNGCALMSEAPARAPNRRFSSLISSFRIRDLQMLSHVNNRTQSIGYEEGEGACLLGDLRSSGMVRERNILP